MDSLQWRRALANLELAFLLDPSFEEAASKQKEMSEFLNAQAQTEYQEGMKAFHLLQFNDALFHWRQAKAHLVDPQDPLALKIENAKRFIDGDFFPASPSHREQAVVPEKMKQVQNFLKEGRKNEALISLKELLYQDPSDSQALALLSQLQEAKRTAPDSPKEAEEIREKLLKAEELFHKGRSALQQKNLTGAYQNFRDSMAQFTGVDVRAPFYSDLEKELKEVEAKLKEELGVKLARFENALKNPNPDLKTMGEEIKAILQKYPPEPKAKELLAQVWEMLEKEAEPPLMKAKTLQELEGCQASKPYFTQAQEAAHFQEVPAWQEAKRNLEGCDKDN